VVLLQPPQGANVEAAWDVTKGSKDIAIGIVDTNSLPQSTDLLGAKGVCNSRCYDFITYNGGFPDEDDHGFTVVSTAATCTDNNVGVAAPNWVSPVYSYNSPFHNSDLATAVLLAGGEKACQGCLELVRQSDISNTSWGSHNPPIGDAEYFKVAEKLLSSGSKVWVAAAGNEEISADDHFPSAIPSVISVGATNKDGRLASFSNFGNRVDILAPGRAIPIWQGGSITNISGTSFSSPLVASIISLVKAAYPENERHTWSWKVAKYLLRKTAKPMTCDQLCPPEVVFLGVSVGYKNSQLCREVWCANDPSIPPAPGLVDAHAAVLEAQNGLPKVALIDSTKYLLLESGEVEIFNRGGGAGQVEIRSNSANVVVDKTSCDLGPLFSDDEDCVIGVTINDLTVEPDWTTLTLKTETKGTGNPHTDWHEIFVAW